MRLRVVVGVPLRLVPGWLIRCPHVLGAGQLPFGARQQRFFVQKPDLLFGVQRVCKVDEPDGPKKAPRERARGARSEAHGVARKAGKYGDHL